MELLVMPRWYQWCALAAICRAYPLKVAPKALMHTLVAGIGKQLK